MMTEAVRWLLGRGNSPTSQVPCKSHGELQWYSCHELSPTLKCTLWHYNAFELCLHFYPLSVFLEATPINALLHQVRLWWQGFFVVLSAGIWSAKTLFTSPQEKRSSTRMELKSSSLQDKHFVDISPAVSLFKENF